VAAATALYVWAIAFIFFRVRARRALRAADSVFPQRRPRREGPNSPARRAFLRRAASGVVVGGAALAGGYSVLVEPRWPRVRRLRFVIPDLPAPLAGLRLCHLTDLHLGHFTATAYLERAVALANAERPDLVLLTGDFIDGSAAFIAQAAQLLRGVRSRWGSVGVLGNHDHWVDAPACRRAFGAAGVRLVDNARVFVGARGLGGPAAGSICVAGVGDYWEDRVDLDAALAGVDPGTPRLLLCHNPDFAESEAARSPRHRVDLMLAGHTHGGQVRLPWGRPIIVPSSYGPKYAHGLVRGPRFPVLVSAGLGVAIFPVRFLVPPEIVIVSLFSS
jgi:predicted MPP superfamily phosphohydrolase